jgi:hypothetical protein
VTRDYRVRGNLPESRNKRTGIVHNDGNLSFVPLNSRTLISNIKQSLMKVYQLFDLLETTGKPEKGLD